MPNNDTANRGYPLPHPENIMAEDATRIAAAITEIDADMQAVQQMAAAADDTLPLPVNGLLAKNARYFLPAGAQVTMPSAGLQEGDWVEFVRDGDMAAQPATIVFGHPVQDIPAGTHSYNANVNRRFTYKNGEWL